MKKFLLSFSFLCCLSAEAREAVVASPGGGLVVTVSDEGGATYSVSLDGTPVVLPSALGFKADFGDFTRGLKIVNTSATQIDREYDMRQVKQSHIHYVATLLTVDFQNADGLRMSVEFSVSDHDVAFRYLIPRQKDDNPKSAVITEEATAFRLPDATTTFLTPQSTAMIGWERTKPSYEEEYTPDAPMTDKSKYGQGYTFPCLFHLNGADKTNDSQQFQKPQRSQQPQNSQQPQDLWLLISETGVSSTYCGSHLSDYSTSQPSIVAPSGAEGGASGAYTIAYPIAGENNGRGDTYAGIALPGNTPWRTITVGRTLKPIVETTIPYDVVEPRYTLNAQTSSTPHSYGRYTWSWLIWQDGSINYDDQVRFIDLAAAMGYEFCLVDNWWDQNIGRDRMEQLSRYAQSKGVRLMLWYNSNGFENDAPQTPRDCMSTGIARDREMAWMQKIGVAGIKVDFFGGDKQETMKLYEDILYDANRYGLQVIFHGCTLPRGWERMYPNFVSSEAVLASENVFFSDYHARQQPFQLTMHPFCRNAVASMDWGGVIMNRYLSKDNKSRHQRQTTDMFEMASAFTNQAAVQCIAMQPNNLQELSQLELDFLRTIPTTWDETRFIDGYPGRYVVLARRHGEQWYVAGLNATKEPLKLTLNLPMFAPSSAVKQMVDVADKKGNVNGVELRPLKLDKQGQARVTIQPNGGIIVL